MNRDAVVHTLRRYAAGLVELGRLAPVLRKEAFAARLVDAIGALDRLRAHLAEQEHADSVSLQFVVLALDAPAGETLAQALERSAQICTHGSSQSSHVSLIALDFLATNDFTRADETQRLRFLQKFEKLLGFKLIIVEPRTNDIVYGIDALHALALGDAP